MPADERRRQLIRTAMQVFARRGFAGTTTREIAAKAGVTEAVIFQHFATKEDLYTAIIDFKASESRADVWIEEMRACGVRNDDVELVRTVVERILDHGATDPQFLRLMLHSALEGHGLFQQFRSRQIQPVFDFLLAYVERRQRDGAFRHGDAVTMVRALVAVPSHYVLQERLFHISDKATGKDIPAELTAFVLAALRPAERSSKRLAAKGRKRGAKSR
jgi:TetR/AcrR family transcriptional regulator